MELYKDLIQVVASIVQVVLTYLIWRVYVRQAKIMEQQKSIMDEQRKAGDLSNKMLKAHQQSGLIVEIYKGFFDNGLNKEIFNFLSNPKNIAAELDCIAVAGGSTSNVSGFSIYPSDQVGDSNRLANYLDDYFGWFELLSHAIESEMVDAEIAKKLFGHYLAESMKPPAVKQYLYMDQEFHWQDLEKLCKLFKVNFPVGHSGTSPKVE